jgi:peptidylprolyl isomerase
MVFVSLQKGSFILVDYVAKVKETGEVFDTTLEEMAKKERLAKEGDVYGPKLVVLGEGWVLKAFEESLATMEVEKPAVVEIPPDKAFGPRDPDKVKRVPLKQLLAKDITPSLGMRVEFNGKTATVRAMGAGRVLLDFNPALAGKTLMYEATVKMKVETVEEKISSLIHRRIPTVEQSKFQFNIKPKNTVAVKMPEEAYFIEGIQLAKRGIAADIQKFLEGITIVKFEETYKAEPQKTEVKPEGKEEKPEEKAPGKQIASELPEKTAKINEAKTTETKI